MNWKRVWTGTLLAGAAVFGIDFLIHHAVLGTTWRALHQAGQVLSPKPYTVPVIALQDWAIGFALTWLYVLARPRLGPGPKTATVMGTIAWFLLCVPAALTRWLWFPLPADVIWAPLLGGYVQCWIGCYLAGWQYMEKAP